MINKSRRTPNPKNRVDDAVEKAVLDYAVAQPAHGQHRTINELRKKAYLYPVVECALYGCDITWKAIKSD